MFGIGGMELIVIFVIALLVLGPDRLPELARWIGRVGRELRRAGDEVRMHLDPDLDDFRRAHRRLLDMEKSLPEKASEEPPEEEKSPEIAESQEEIED